MIALSIKQPWAWAIIHAGKDIENRDWSTQYRGRVLIHASKGVTRAEYEESAWAIGPGIKCPSLKEIERGGIIGAATIVDCVTDSASRWFVGDYGFVLADPKPCPFVPCRGALGFWKVPADVASKLAADAQRRERADG